GGGDGRGGAVDLGAEPAQGVEVGAEDLERDRRGHAAEHVADAVGERSADDGQGAGHGFEAAVEVGEDFGAGARGGARGGFTEIDVELGGGDGHDVVAAPGAAEAAAAGAGFGHSEELPFD